MTSQFLDVSGDKFLFFFNLGLSIERLIAFSFHRKAFNDRLETLEVIGHLRGNRPNIPPNLHLIILYFHHPDTLLLPTKSQVLISA